MKNSKNVSHVPLLRDNEQVESELLSISTGGYFKNCNNVNTLFDSERRKSFSPIMLPHNFDIYYVSKT